MPSPQVPFASWAPFAAPLVCERFWKKSSHWVDRIITNRGDKFAVGNHLRRHAMTFADVRAIVAGIHIPESTFAAPFPRFISWVHYLLHSWPSVVVQIVRSISGGRGKGLAWPCAG